MYFLAGEKKNCLNAVSLCFPRRVLALQHWLGKQFYKREFYSFAPDTAFLASFELQVSQDETSTFCRSLELF